jgi:beta-phosphoglucomutase-like phosphatase (HAD superfamily)
MPECAVHAVEAILFEPVGTLADFKGGSLAYWDRVESLASRLHPLPEDERIRQESWELLAVEQAVLYEDAAPALLELAGLGLRLIAASSLSEIALSRFLERTSLQGAFHDRWSRDRAGGVAQTVLTRALAAGSLAPDRVMFLADTAAGLRAARSAGVHPILMMNDPDEAMRLTACNPAGGIVSLHELPDFIRFLVAKDARAAFGWTPGHQQEKGLI